MGTALRRASLLIRPTVVGLACLVYLFTGLVTCSGHAGYFREALMHRAECTGTTLDFLAATGAVVASCVAVGLTRTAKGRWLMAVIAVFFLGTPALAAIVNCG
jgi:hypothetical protein